MLRIGANAHHHAMTADDFALIADRFDGWSDFHVISLLVAGIVYSKLVLEAERNAPAC